MNELDIDSLEGLFVFISLVIPVPQVLAATSEQILKKPKGQKNRTIVVDKVF